MDTSDRIIVGSIREEDQDEATLRPQRFADFVGQRQLIDNLGVFVAAAKKRGEALDHVLFCGPPGLGKTTMARILANELGVGIHTTSGPVLEKKGDLAGSLTNLADREIFFIDEIHRLNRVVEECLYPAIEDFVFDIITGEGPAARSIRIPLNKFTLVGSTTRAGMLTSPMLSRFGYVGRMNYYVPEDLQTIVLRSARILGVDCESDAAHELGRRARGTPRIVNRLLRRARDVAEVKADGRVTLAIVRTTLAMLGIDDNGLDEMDRRILNGIVENYGGGPVGLTTIAVVVGEEPDTIEEVYEPYLIQSGYLKRTPRGREVTRKTYEYLNIRPPKNIGESQVNLFEEPK
jgi:Holliday junction DNA helicase RuvB